LLGIRKLRPLFDRRVHFLKPEAFDSLFQLGRGRIEGVTKPWEDIVCVRSEPSRPLAERLARLLHELWHQAGLVRFSATHDFGIDVAQTGYRVRSAWKSDALHENAFLAFNEMVVEHSVVHMMFAHKAFLEAELGITESEIGQVRHGYEQYVDPFISILRGVARKFQSSTAATFHDFQRGHFGPTLLVLKKIEPAFGTGAVRVLAAMGIRYGRNIPEELGKTIDDLAIRFFTTATEAERLAISLQLKHIFETLPVTTSDGSESTG